MSAVDRTTASYFGLSIGRAPERELVSIFKNRVVSPYTQSRVKSCQDRIVAFYDEGIKKILSLVREDTEYSSERETLNVIEPFSSIFVGSMEAALFDFDFYVNVMQGAPNLREHYGDRFYDVGISSNGSLEDIKKRIRSQYFSSDEDPLEVIYRVVDLSILTNKTMLIFCQYGLARSPSILIAYLMKRFHLDYYSALTLVRVSRPAVDPGFSLSDSLHEYEKSLKSST